MEVLELLRQTPLFAEMSQAELEPLVPSTRVETYPAGRVILRERRVGAAFLMVVSGAVEVIKDMGTPEQRVVATLGVGDFFGELAVMKHVLRSATVKAVTETQCLVIQRLHLDSFFEEHPNVLARVNSVVSARYGGSGTKTTKKSDNYPV